MAWALNEAHWTGRPVLVTGATGFLGSHLTRLLLAAGAEVTVLRRDRVPPTSIEVAWADRVTWVDGPVEDQALLERILGEHAIRTVFHLAAQTQVGVANANPISTFEANVRGSWSLLEAVRRSPRVEQTVMASSDKAYGTQPFLPYTEDMPLRAVHPYDVSKACRGPHRRLVSLHVGGGGRHHPLRQLLRARGPELGSAGPGDHPEPAPR